MSNKEKEDPKSRNSTDTVDAEETVLHEMPPYEEGMGEPLPKPDAETLQLIELLLNHMTIEGERFWQRNSVFVTISTGLFGLYAVKFEEFSGLLHIIYGFVGLVIALGWRQTVLASNYYAERWRLDARAYIGKFEGLPDIMRSAMGQARVPEPTGPKSSKVMLLFGTFSCIMWLSAMVWGGYLIARGPITTFEKTEFCFSQNSTGALVAKKCGKKKRSKEQDEVVQSSVPEASPSSKNHEYSENTVRP